MQSRKKSISFRKTEVCGIDLCVIQCYSSHAIPKTRGLKPYFNQALTKLQDYWGPSTDGRRLLILSFLPPLYSFRHVSCCITLHNTCSSVYQKRRCCDHGGSNNKLRTAEAVLQFRWCRKICNILCMFACTMDMARNHMDTFAHCRHVPHSIPDPVLSVDSRWLRCTYWRVRWVRCGGVLGDALVSNLGLWQVKDSPTRGGW